MSNKKPKSIEEKVRLREQQVVLRTDMDNMAFSVDHNVAVVAIFDLENVAGNRVRSHRLNKVQSSPLEGHCILSAILGDEKVE